MRIQTLEVEADLEEVSASCGHFSFSLLEFGEELKVLLSILDELHLEAEERPNGKSWSWLKFWHWNEPEGDVEEPVDIGEYQQLDALHEHFILTLALEQPHNSDVAWDTVRGNNSSNFYEREGRTPLYPHGFADMPGAGRVGYRIWKSLGFFRRDDTKYAIKVGTGAAMYALPSFLSSTRPFYTHWRGEWGLLSYMLVCSMTIGSSNTTGYARFSGTSLGATCAIVSWYVSEGNPVGLAFLGFLMSTWTSYIILVKGRGPMGRFIMLTYNLSVLYAYSLLITKDMPALENAIPKVITSVNKRNGSHALWGIKCSDKTTRASNLTQIRPYLSSSWSVSRLLGDVSDGFEAACAQWEMSAKEHYNGDFHAKTSQPILLIGNTNDPITPLSAAHNMSAGFEGSVVLQQNSSAVCY